MPEPTRSDPVLWVIGARGLLGSSVVAAARSRMELWSPPQLIPWSDTPATHAALARAAAAFLAHADGRPWQVAWCAGVGVSSTMAEALRVEVEVFTGLLAELEAAGAGPEGAVFLASSAGGVYAGSSGPPFDETTAPAAISPYGEAKLALEEALSEFHSRMGASVLLGRIANLYGPGQDVSKPQGLITHICRAQLMRRPISIYVPLDTVRNYLYAGDCGEMVVAALARLQAEARRAGPLVVTKVFASYQDVSVAYVVSELARVLKRRPQVVYGWSPASAFQAIDLRVRSRVWPEIDALASTSLVAGMNATIQGLQRSHMSGELT